MLSFATFQAFHEIKKKQQNFNHANETAIKYFAISLSSTSIQSEHASISCCSREHFLFDFELLHDVQWKKYLVEETECGERGERKKTKRENTLHTHWIECGFLVVPPISRCCCFSADPSCWFEWFSPLSNTIFMRVYSIFKWSPRPSPHNGC